MKHIFKTKQILNSFLGLSLWFISISAHAFTDLNSKKDDIANHIGKNKWTIVEVWESKCHACRMHMPEMVKFDGKLKNARIVGISVDGQQGIDDVEDFIDEYDIKFPTLISNVIEMNAWMETNIGESFIGTPTFILFDQEGKLVAAQPGIVSTASLETFIKQNSGPVDVTPQIAQKQNTASKKSEVVYDGVSD